MFIVFWLLVFILCVIASRIIEAIFEEEEISNMGGTIIGVLFVCVCGYGLYTRGDGEYFNKDKYSTSSYSQSSTTTNMESKHNYTNNESDGEECQEPENPYGDGGGHDAGRQWGEEGNDCSGNSDSFIEGCEEYEEAAELYDECTSK